VFGSLTGGRKMDRELKRMNGIYIAVTIFITTAMLVGAAYIQQVPESFFF
jgi:hypothetical protein